LLIEMALAQDEAGDIQGAAEAIKEAFFLVDRQGNDARETTDTASVAARIFKKLGRDREILGFLRTVFGNNPGQHDPSICRMTIQLGNAFSDLGEFTEAYSWYSRALSMIPPNGRYRHHDLASAHIHHEMAVLHKRNGQNGDALAEIEKVLLRTATDDANSVAQ